MEKVARAGPAGAEGGPGDAPLPRAARGRDRDALAPAA